MKKVGNTTSNKLYNSQNKKPAIPVDADEADSAMERFIRSKYMQQGTSIMRSHNTGSTGSDETPPPLPPKTPGKFSFRSASSTFPLFHRSKKHEPTRSTNFDPQYPPESPESGRQPKVTQTFGANLGYDSEGDTQKKMAKLRELGFTNDRKNEAILKGLHGNLERTIEALVRLEGRSPLTSPVDEFPSAPTRPMVSTTGGQMGLTVARAETARPSTSSTNPFDISPAQPMSAQSTGNLANFGTRNPFLNNSNTNNPFGMASHSNDAMNQAFNNMALAPPPQSQPLFPHHTGGLPNQQQQGQQVVYQQTMTPPVPSVPQNYAATAFNSNQPYAQHGQQSGLQPAQPLQPSHTGYNPFFNNAQAQQQQGYSQPQMASYNTGLVSTPTGGFANNPFNRSPTRIASPSLGQIPEQSQPAFYNQQQAQQPQQPLLQQQQHQPQQQMNNPFFSQQNMNPFMNQQQPQQSQQQPLYDQFGQQIGQQLQQPQFQQAPQRPNTASIMALYNQPQLAPQPQQNANLDQQQQQQQQQYQQQQPTSSNQVMQAPNAPAAHAEAPAVPANMTVSGHNNPFMNGGATPQPAPTQNGGMDAMVGNRSRDSMMALGMEWSNGRHSPDAFASLSARSR